MRPLFAVLFALAVPLCATAAPRDEALRLAPPDAPITVVAQNLREHARAVAESPFAAWFPTTALGKQLFAGEDGLKQFLEVAGPVLRALDTTPAELFDDVIGDAVVFSYTPATGRAPERSLILVRPRKPEVLAKLADKLNGIQLKNGELKGVAEHKHAGATYYARQQPNGSANYYAFAGPVFAFSESEADIKTVLERAARDDKDKQPELVARLTALGVADAALVLLVHPRAFDAELASKAERAPAAERAGLARLQAVWKATETAAVYVALDTGAEVGVSVRFAADKLPADAKAWLTGARAPSALWQAVPNDALFAVAGRMKASELLDAMGALTAAAGKPGFRDGFDAALGPIVGKDKLPKVLDALGPDFGAWVQPPAKGTSVPVLVAAVRVKDGATAEAKAALAALEFGFQSARVAYNAKHADQMELDDEKDGDVTIRVLSGGPLPAGAKPCFALKGGYLLVASAPEAIRAFRAPTAEPKPGGAVPVARFGASATRDYLTAHAGALAKFLSATGAGDEKALAEQLAAFAAVLEPFEKVELLAHGDANGLRLALRATTAKPLRKEK
jgi:hypothetical protein